MPNMGREKPAPSGLASALFSRVQQRVLGLLFTHPDRSFHASEIIRLVHSGSGAVQRELAKLSKAGLITASVSANRKLYQANRHSPIFRDLYGLLAKTVGLADPIRHALEPFHDEIKLAFVYGSVARGGDTTKSDIDLMIVGDHLSYEKIYAALRKAEGALRRPINPTLVTEEEWARARDAKRPFLARVKAAPKLYIAGPDDRHE